MLMILLNWGYSVKSMYTVISFLPMLCMCVSCFQHVFSMCKLWRRVCYKPGYYRAFQIFSEQYKHGASICKSSLTDVHNVCINLCVFFWLFVASNSKKRTIMDITKKYQLFPCRFTPRMSRQTLLLKLCTS